MNKPESQFMVAWIDLYREPKSPPNPCYPEGIDLDVSNGAIICCTVELAYPARRCGHYTVVCKTCGITAMCTTAGRRDDPRSLTLACKQRNGLTHADATTA